MSTSDPSMLGTGVDGGGGNGEFSIFSAPMLRLAQHLRKNFKKFAREGSATFGRPRNFRPHPHPAPGLLGNSAAHEKGSGFGLAGRGRGLTDPQSVVPAPFGVGSSTNSASVTCGWSLIGRKRTRLAPSAIAAFRSTWPVTLMSSRSPYLPGSIFEAYQRRASMRFRARCASFSVSDISMISSTKPSERACRARS